MAFSNIQSNVAAMINKAYSADNSISANSTASTHASGKTQAASSTKKDVPVAESVKDNPAGVSAEVKLGQTGNTTEIYSAQGLLQQMRQIQLSNSMLMFGDDEENNDDTTGLMGMTGSQSTEESDWTEAISQQPEQAAVMVEKAKNSVIKTILTG